MSAVVTAIHTFVAEHSDELEFTAGEKITVLERDDAFGDGWWKGRNAKGQEGLFPATYIDEGPVDGAVDGAASTGPDVATDAATAAPAPAAAAPVVDAAPSAVALVPSAAEIPAPISPAAGSPIPLPPSPQAPTLDVAKPASPDVNAQSNGLASSPAYVAPASTTDTPERNSLLDVTGQPHSTPSVVAASRGGAPGTNVMGSTIGQVQEAIDTMGKTSPNAPKGVQLKDPQEAEREANAAAEQLDDKDDDEDEDVSNQIGIASDARARLAQQAKLANEERDRKNYRDSGGIADLIYSDESDDEEEPPNMQGRLSLNGPPTTNGSALGYGGMASSPARLVSSPQGFEASQDSTPIASPTAATGPTSGATGVTPAAVGLVNLAPTQDNTRATSASSSPHLAAAATVPAAPPVPTAVPVERPVPADQPTGLPYASDNGPGLGRSPPSTGAAIGIGAAAATTAGIGAAAAASHTLRNVSPATHTRNLSNDGPIPNVRTSSIGGSPAMSAHARLPAHGTPPQVDTSAVPTPAHPGPQGSTTFPPSSSGEASSVRSAKPVSAWSIAEVVEWARGKGFDEGICAKFVEHEISGDVLLELDAATLKELDIPQFGKRVRIATAINELRRPSSVRSGSSPHPPVATAGPGERASEYIPAGAAAAGAQSSRTYSAPPSAYGSSHAPTPTSAVSDDNQAWGHGRKVSMTPSTPAIDEGSVVSGKPPVNGNGIHQRGSESTLISPTSPGSTGGATVVSSGAASAAAAAATAATMASLSKRESSSSLGHNRGKGSIDKGDRLSFFGRGRKQAPPPPAAPNQSSSRMAFNHTGKQTTTMAAAAPAERRTSGTPATAASVGSAMRTIGTPDKTGYLKKRGDRYNTWKSRFFVLKDSHLYYLKSEAEDRVKGRIDLRGHRIIVDENTNPGHYGFRLVGPGNEKAHYFSSSEQGVVRDWMKALMKATIARDYTVPVTSSCNIPTIPLNEAQALQPRPPSPSQIDATQRATRRENVNQLTPRDASVLMSLDTTSSGRRMTSHGSSIQQSPSRPSRDTRPASTSRTSVGRPSVSPSFNSSHSPQIASYYPPEDEHHAELMTWVNTVLPAQYPRAAYFPNSFISGEVIFLIVKHLSGIEPNPPLAPSAFTRDASGQPNVEGLFAMMDCVIDAGIDSAGVSLNEIRAGDSGAVATLLDSVRAWATQRGVA